MKLFIIVGTRPQFLKLAPLLNFLEDKNINSVVLHTGQHYDTNLSKKLFESLKITEPKYKLKECKLTGVRRLSNMMAFIEDKCLLEKPDKIIVFGDCDSTTAGALVAKNLKIKLVHIEAGMRSYNKNMPEEINRILTDHISDILLCSTEDSVKKLTIENINENVFYVGNLQLELLKKTCDVFNDKYILNQHRLIEQNFILLTIHRHYNTNETQMKLIFKSLENLNIKVVFPIHPRTKNIIEKYDIYIPDNIILIDPVNYLNMTILERYCKFIITDSGGIQPEAWFLGKKCIVMRSETEWIEPLKNNNNIIYDYKTPLDIFINNFLQKPITPVIIGTNVSQKIYELLKDN